MPPNAVTARTGTPGDRDRQEHQGLPKQEMPRGSVAAPRQHHSPACRDAPAPSPSRPELLRCRAATLLAEDQCKVDQCRAHDQLRAMEGDLRKGSPVQARSHEEAARPEEKSPTTAPRERAPPPAGPKVEAILRGASNGSRVAAVRRDPVTTPTASAAPSGAQLRTVRHAGCWTRRGRTERRAQAVYSTAVYAADASRTGSREYATSCQARLGSPIRQSPPRTPCHQARHRCRSRRCSSPVRALRP